MPPQQIQRALESFEGLSIGDALGQCYFGMSRGHQANSISSRITPGSPWLYTDDTEMAMSVVGQLIQRGRISQDELASDFAARYSYDRAYGPAMHRALERIRTGEAWRMVAGSLYVGQGSFGNGAAMRSAPIGAYFMESTDAMAREATLSAEVTHAHPEAIAGAIAVAAAALVASRSRCSGQPPAHAEFLAQVASLVPDSEVRVRIDKARSMDTVRQIDFPVSVLGAGEMMAAHDTVPFALWCCAQSLSDYECAMWLGIQGGVDRDTICAIIGGVVTCYVGRCGIQDAWLRSREPLPDWFVALQLDVAAR